MYEVIAEFVDKNTGERILPGQPLPETMDRDQLGRLLRAKCLKRLPAQTGLLAEVEPADAKKVFAKGTPKKSATKAAKPKAADWEVGPSQAGFLSDDDPSALAGGDGDASGERAKPARRGRKRSKS